MESQNAEFSINDANKSLNFISDLIQEYCPSVNHANVSDCFLNELHMLITVSLDRIHKIYYKTYSAIYISSSSLLDYVSNRLF